MARIVDALATTEALSAIFGDASVVQALLDVEAALARAQAASGVIPASAAVRRSRRPRVADGFDADALAREARASATIAIPLVAALTARVEAVDPDAARFVHWGATSQDIVDTAVSLLIERAGHALARDHAALAATASPAVGSARRHGDARPHAAAARAADHVRPEGRGLVRRACAGAGRASSRRGATRRASSWAARPARSRRSAIAARRWRTRWRASSGCRLPTDAPWHTSRDRLAALVAACAIYAGVLGKIARDVSLLMQFEVGEAREAGGGSSAMPHKQNPSGCARTLAAAARLPGLAATMLAGLVQEHERAVGAWQAEWPVIAEALQATGAALEAMRDVIAGLAVDPARMRANLDATRGAIFAERVVMLAAPVLGRSAAHQLLKDALARSQASGQSLADIVRAVPELAGVVDAEALRSLDDPRAYLGAAETLRQRLLASIEEPLGRDLHAGRP